MQNYIFENHDSLDSKKKITVFINVLEHLANSVDFYEVNLTESLQNSSKMT